ncbi:MAG: cytochrome-c oxidase, partial [Gammaproteobacteria bacterium]|nr:cytochrome-c oxidase [Gammaproteobacteria bacterium]
MGGEAAIVIFIFVAVGFGWTWLWRQRVTEKPWLQEGVIEDHPSEVDPLRPAARTALYVFLAVVTSVFSLFFSAYFLRMEYFDWRPLQEPVLLWLNTLLLALASVAFQMAANAAKKNDIDTMGLGLI